MTKDNPEFKNTLDHGEVVQEAQLEKNVICTINSLIEVLDLPYSKIRSLNPDLIGIKILELSKGKKFNSMIIYQRFLLQYLVLKLCPDARAAEMVHDLAKKKHQHLVKTGELT
jgi:hypothetical protein